MALNLSSYYQIQKEVFTSIFFSNGLSEISKTHFKWAYFKVRCVIQNTNYCVSNGKAAASKLVANGITQRTSSLSGSVICTTKFGVYIFLHPPVNCGNRSDRTGNTQICIHNSFCGGKNSCTSGPQINELSLNPFEKVSPTYEQNRLENTTFHLHWPLAP